MRRVAHRSHPPASNWSCRVPMKTGSQEPRYRIRNEEVEGDEKVVMERDLRNPGGAERLRAPKARAADILTTQPRKARRPERVASDRCPADGSSPWYRVRCTGGLAPPL